MDLFGVGRTTRTTYRFAILLCAVAILAGTSGSALAIGPPPTPTITGQVVRDSPIGAGVEGARVIATRPNGPPFVATTDVTGGFGLLAPDGSYSIGVRAPEPTTTSPDWVASLESLNLAVPPTQIDKKLIVTTATVTINGALSAPGGVPFNPPNRAWVRAENQEGRGNTVLVAANGSFGLKTLPGAVLLSIVLENKSWAAPVALRGLFYNANAGDTINVVPNPLVVVVKGATISGRVDIRGASGIVGPAPACIPVRAWRVDGAEYQDAFTDNSGNYSMQVISGTWALRSVPQPDTLYGNPSPCTPFTGGATYFVPAQSPQRVVLESDTATSANNNLQIAAANVTVSGQTVNSQGIPITNADTDGRVYTLYYANGKPEFGPSAPLSDGAFANMRLSTTVAATYTVGIYFPPDSPYTALARPPLRDLLPNATPTITIPIAISNSHITGTLRLSDGGAYPVGLPGMVWGASNSGSWARTRVNPADGTYDLRATTTDVRGSGGSFWRVRAFVDPTSGYLLQRPREQRTFIPFNNGNGATIANVNFLLLNPATFGTISGTVTSPPLTVGGTPLPLPGVRVSVREMTGDGTTALVRDAITNMQGQYSVRVPAGTYRITSTIGDPINLIPRLLLPPAPVVQMVIASTPVNVNLRYRLRDAVVNGQVTFNGIGHAAFVRAKASDGTVVTGAALSNGNYELRLLSGMEWRIDAVSSEGSNFLRSPAQALTPSKSPPAQTGPTLVLAIAAPLPESQFFDFAADTDQVLTLSDGSRVQVPAGALAEDSRQVSITVRPLPELAGDGSVTPISFGYRLNAFDLTNGQPITNFLQPITLVIPFTASQLQALGITADRLVPSYWDVASSSWKPVENVTVNVDETGGGTVNIAVEHFTDFSLLAASGTTVNLPLVVK